MYVLQRNYVQVEMNTVKILFYYYKHIITSRTTALLTIEFCEISEKKLKQQNED